MPHWKCPSLCGKICRGFLSYSDLILISYYIFPSSPPFTCNESLIPLYHFNSHLGFQFPMQNNAMHFHVFFSGNLEHNLLLRRGEKESGGENNRWILLRYLLVFCFARCSLRYCVLVQIRHHPLYFYLIVDRHLAMEFLTMRQFQQWSIGQCPSAITWFLLFILNHKCRQLPAERMKFDIAASVIFKEPRGFLWEKLLSACFHFFPKKVSFPSKFLEKTMDLTNNALTELTV